jgi:hypothetical protein
VIARAAGATAGVALVAAVLLGLAARGNNLTLYGGLWHEVRASQ